MRSRLFLNVISNVHVFRHTHVKYDTLLYITMLNTEYNSIYTCSVLFPHIFSIMTNHLTTVTGTVLTNVRGK